ncbi:MAG: 1-phosphofructokinase [Geodermatophilaceae bacterium]|nr:1-phosphofructokinase [Geodermatophilaceae bacterium]
MIVTLTLNPSLDRSIEIASFDRGAVIRASATRLDPGGKGVNVARALAEHQVKACAVLPRSGPDGAQLTALLQQDGIDVSPVQVDGATRSNVSLVEPDGTVTKINEPGGRLSADDLDGIIEAVLSVAGGADWVVACGSLPPGVPDDFYARLCHLLSRTGVPVALDTSGPALRAAIPAVPALVKPNRDELADFAGYRIDTLGAAITAAATMRRTGAGMVLASLGADGALLVSAEGCLYGEAPVAQRRNSVGAGDAMLAGFLAADAAGRDALVEALAWGAAAVSLPGSRMPGPDDIDRSQVRIHRDPDPERVLHEAHRTPLIPSETETLS